MAALDLLVNSDLRAIEVGRDELKSKLKLAEGYIGRANFSATSLTLGFAQDELNANGGKIIGGFVNATADTIYDRVVDFSERTVDAVETDVANCQPLYSSISMFINAACVNVVSFPAKLFSHFIDTNRIDVDSAERQLDVELSPFF